MSEVNANRSGFAFSATGNLDLQISTRTNRHDQADYRPGIGDLLRLNRRHRAS
jgi:hypothetical protein